MFVPGLQCGALRKSGHVWCGSSIYDAVQAETGTEQKLLASPCCGDFPTLFAH